MCPEVLERLVPRLLRRHRRLYRLVRSNHVLWPLKFVSCLIFLSAVPPPAPVFPPAVVAGLVEMGFREDAVIAALRSSNGDANQACFLLLSAAQP